MMMTEFHPSFNPPPGPESGTVFLMERDDFIRNYVECILKWYGYVCQAGKTFEEISKLVSQDARDRPALVIAEWSDLRSRMPDWTRLQTQSRFPLKILGLIDDWEAVKPHPGSLPAGVALLSKPFSPTELAEHIVKSLL